MEKSTKRFGIGEVRKVGLRLVFLTMALFLSACADKEASVNENLVNLYVDLRVCENMYGDESADARLARQEILKKYGYDREQFLREVGKVLAEKELWVPFQKAANERIDFLLGIPKPEEPKKKGKK